MTTLFHGSYTEITTPLVKIGRNRVDFGKGFYLTKIKEQASNWATVISLRKGPAYKPVVNEFQLDMDKVISKGFRYKSFEEYNLEWLEYVVDSRNAGHKQDFYDIVEGGVANDNVIDTVEDYENGRITAEQALGQLKYKKINHQICILNQSVVDECLTFVKSEITEA